MINIVITMGGNGRRFREKGYDVSKYMIEVKNKTLFEWSMLSLENFKKLNPKYIFVVKKSDNAIEFIKTLSIKLGLENINIIEIDELTDGQATTALLAENQWSEELPLLIYNIDTHVSPKVINPVDFVGDGFIPCFNAPGEMWSFVKVGKDGRVTEVREKKRISDNATIGMYYFSSAGLYKKAYNEYYKESKNLEKGEKYIAPLYNYLVEKGYIVKMNKINYTDVYPLGIPDEVEAFEKNKYIL